MDRHVTLSGAALNSVMAMVHQLGSGQDLDDVLSIVERTVTDVIGFDACAVNVLRADGDLEVRAVTGPPEVESVHGGRLPESQWQDLLRSCERWGGLYFSRRTEFPTAVPSADPWVERIRPGTDDVDTGRTPGFIPSEPWRTEYALLVPAWVGGRVGGRLQCVISVDMPRSGRTPDPEQHMLLEVFGLQVGLAIARVSESERAHDRVQLYRAAFTESPHASALLDSALRITDVNTAFLELADAVPGELNGRALGELVDVDSGELATRFASLSPNRHVTSSLECGLRHPRGVAWNRWVEVTARRVDSINDDPRYVCTVTDRTETRDQLDAMRHRADHDDLTGLSVRAVWLAELGARVVPPLDTPPHPDGDVVGVLFCDLDGFKKVNDVSGHRAGDAVLVEVAHRLLAAAAPTDKVCRWGGDEFAVVANRGSVEEIVRLADDIAEAVRELASISAETDPAAGLSISIGIAAVENPTAVGTLAGLVEMADSALYQVKGDPARRTRVTVV